MEGEREREKRKMFRMKTGEKDGAREEENGNTFTRWIEMLSYNQ